MKESSKEYLMAGAGFAGLFVKKMVTGTIYGSGTGSARRIQEHWDKAGALREEEKAAAKIPVGGAFVLPYCAFKDSKGNYVAGGKWRLRMVDGLRLLLYNQEAQDVRHLFPCEDIKEYYDPSL